MGPPCCTTKAFVQLFQVCSESTRQCAVITAAAFSCRGLVLDATVKGGEARFINHSCDANCHTEKWLVRGETRVGIFSHALIPKGTEVTYDYNLEWNGHARVPYAPVRCTSRVSNPL